MDQKAWMLLPLADTSRLTAQRRAALLVGAGWLCALPLVFALGGATSLLDRDEVSRLATWATPFAFATAAVLCLARSRVSAIDRGAWRWFGIACGCWTVSNTLYALLYAPDAPPLPSVLDVGYIAFPIAVLLGLRNCARERLPLVPLDVWLDAALAALATAAVATAVMFAAVDVDTAHHPRLLATLLYPVEDVVILAALAGLLSLLGTRLSRDWRHVALGITAIAASDFLVFGRVLSDSPTVGAWTNTGWTLGIALIATGAWQRPSLPAAVTRPVRRLPLGVPVAFAALALAVLTFDRALDLTPAASILATAALLVCFARLYRSFREVLRLAESRRLAFTDDLTGLANRRRLLADLDRVYLGDEARVLALFDLDGFKTFNDTRGHPAGDRLLHTLGTRLEAAVGTGARAYRLGGDEFCVLMRVSNADAIVVAAGQALTDRGPGWAVSASCGVVELPREATTAAAALGVADRRMYAEKDRRPVAARQQARDVLLSAIGEQQPELYDHVNDVTGFAADVARELGMPPDEVDDVVRAAELHDVGKLAVSRAVLDKPGPLDDEEWAVMRSHTIVGERMLNAAPALASVAPLVRSSHERWDGAGYPDGLAGEQIPLGARIITVCDAFDAMVSDRPYRPGMALEEALAEVARGSGTQFDPRVVVAFRAAFAVWRPPDGATTPTSA